MPRSLILAVVSLVLVAACSNGGAPATPSPTPPAQCCTPGPTVAPTVTAAPSATVGSTAGYSCDPDMGYGCDASPSAATPPPAGEPLVVGVSDDGTRLVGPTELTLYVFDNDSPGVSACNSGCTSTWPPLTLAPGQELSAPSDIAANFSTFTREDGSTQVAYNDRPLYYYTNDESPGDIRGDGIGDVWHVAAP